MRVVERKLEERTVDFIRMGGFRFKRADGRVYPRYGNHARSKTRRTNQEYHSRAICNHLI